MPIFSTLLDHMLHSFIKKAISGMVRGVEQSDMYPPLYDFPIKMPVDLAGITALLRVRLPPASFSKSSFKANPLVTYSFNVEVAHLRKLVPILLRTR